MLQDHPRSTRTPRGEHPWEGLEHSGVWHGKELGQHVDLLVSASTAGGRGPPGLVFNKRKTSQEPAGLRCQEPATN